MEILELLLLTLLGVIILIPIGGLVLLVMSCIKANTWVGAAVFVLVCLLVFTGTFRLLGPVIMGHAAESAIVYAPDGTVETTVDVPCRVYDNKGENYKILIVAEDGDRYEYPSDYNVTWVPPEPSENE